MADQFATYQPDPDVPRSAAPVTIRPATAADAPPLANLVQAREGGDLAAHRAGFLAEVADAKRLVLVATLDGEVVGYGRVRHVQLASPRPANAGPDGWYLMGTIVAPAHRRRGVGRALTRARLAWIRERSSEAYYFVNAQNRASLDLHASFGFQEATRDFYFPDLTFTGGVGILFRLGFGGCAERTVPLGTP